MKIALFPLCALIFSAIVNLKNIPAAAIFGSQLFFFLAGAAVLFFIPTAFISARLAANFPKHEGVYQWIREGFGARTAMTASWLQWTNTLFWYPSILAFIAGTFAYAISPDLAENRWYLLLCILTVLWGLTWVNLKGMQASVRLTTICMWSGTTLPLILLIVLGFFWVINGNTTHIHFTQKEMLPSLTQVDSWSGLVAIMASFLGIELACAYVNEIKDPKKTLPKAILIAAIGIFVVLGLSALAIAAILPSKEIDLLSGVMQVFQYLFNQAYMGSLTIVFALAITFGSIGAMINWLIAPAQGLYHGAKDGFLPIFLVKKNKQGAASSLLIMQAVIVSLFSSLFLLVPSIQECFWIFTVVSTILYMAMYILMFFAAIKLKVFSKIPLYFLSGLGITGCLVTMIIGFVPPETLLTQDLLTYCLMIAGGIGISISPLLFFFHYQYRKKQLI